MAKAHSALAAAGASGDAQETDREETEESEEPQLNGLLVAIDPGHQGAHVDMSAKEENAPGSGEMESKGYRRDNRNVYRHAGISVKFGCISEGPGSSCGTGISGSAWPGKTTIQPSAIRRGRSLPMKRGRMCACRIHANGSEDAVSQGALCLVMSPDNPYVGQLYEESNKLAENVLHSYCQATGFADQGVVTNDTMTGLNWSEIPVMILEMGFMTNEHDDTKMADASFQDQMAEGIAEGIDAYFGI